MNSNLYQLGVLMMALAPKRSLIIGRGPHVCDLGEALRKVGFAVVETSEYSQGIKSLAVSAPEVVIISEDILDAWHPTTFVTIRELEEVPILVLGSGEESSLVSAIEWGADAYLDQRASSQEHIARIRAVLRRLSMTRASQYFWLRLQ